MEKKSTFSISKRSSTGRFENFSQGMSFPELISLIHYSSTRTLIDFAPLVDVWSKSLGKHVDEEICAQYNAVFNRWQDSKSYEEKSTRDNFGVQIVTDATNLIARLESVLNNHVKSFKSARVNTDGIHPSNAGGNHRAWEACWNEKLQIANKIKQCCDFYSWTLICLIHSKARIELKSFKKDVVVRKIAEDLLHTVQQLYGSIVDYNFNEQKFYDSSIMRTLVLTRNEEIDLFLKALPGIPSADALRLAYFDEVSINTDQDGAYKMVRLPWFWPQQLECARIFRNIILKVQFIVEVVYMFKNNELEWDSNPERMDQFMAFLEGKSNE